MALALSALPTLCLASEIPDPPEGTAPRVPTFSFPTRSTVPTAEPKEGQPSTPGPTIPMPGKPAESRQGRSTPPTVPISPSLQEVPGFKGAARTLVVPEDGAASVTLSQNSLNRLLLPDPITAAYTNTESVDVTLDGRTAIITFRTVRAADVLLLSTGGQYLLHLVPTDMPTQTVWLRLKKPEPRVASSYQTQLTSLIEAAYRRQPPSGYRTERVAAAEPVDGALYWYLTLRHRGRQLTVQEYALYNSGAVAHPTDPSRLAARFPTARAVSADPLLLAPGAWGRVFVIVDTDTLPDQAQQGLLK